jgi:hypothetical protein
MSFGEAQILFYHAILQKGCAKIRPSEWFNLISALWRPRLSQRMSNISEKNADDAAGRAGD